MCFLFAFLGNDIASTYFKRLYPLDCLVLTENDSSLIYVRSFKVVSTFDSILKKIILASAHESKLFGIGCNHVRLPCDFPEFIAIADKLVDLLFWMHGYC